MNNDYKRKRPTGEVEGISFRHNNISYKGSKVDRKFSFGNIKKRPKVYILDVFVYKFMYKFCKLLKFSVYCGEEGSENYYIIQFH
ncbi:MAG: hypothetical protein ACK5MG_01820 [Bacteroidales bacterium]